MLVAQVTVGTVELELVSAVLAALVVLVVLERAALAMLGNHRRLCIPCRDRYCTVIQAQCRCHKS